MTGNVTGIIMTSSRALALGSGGKVKKENKQQIDGGK